MPRIEEDVMEAPVSKKDCAPALRPFVWHGVKLNDRGKEAVGDCPFCQGVRKFSVNVEKGQWRCLKCNVGEGTGPFKGGNVYTFLNLLWGEGKRLASGQCVEAIMELAEERRLLSADTLEAWGVVPSPLTGEWLLPGFNESGKLVNLYRYVKIEGKYRWLATPELGHGLHGVNLFNHDCREVDLCEGPWDGMALWELYRLGMVNDEDGSWSLAGVPEAGELRRRSVLAVPGCGVFKEEWGKLLPGKVLNLCYDNDHPKQHPTTGQTIPGAGYEGMRRIVVQLATAPERPERINVLDWSGGEGTCFNSDLPDGWDVRDALTEYEDDRDQAPVATRLTNLESMLALVSPFPQEWLQGIGGNAPGVHTSDKAGEPVMELLPCHDYDTLDYAWTNCMHWIPGLRRGLIFTLGVIVSTKLKGDQLFGMLLGPASCGKTTIVEGVSVNRRYVLPKSSIRGFHSGYKSDKDGTEDNSLINLCKDKTLIIKDADTLLTSPNRDQILAEMRDVWDRSTSAHYRHGMNRDYRGLNLTVILCGTSGLRVLDSSELGQRFLTCEIMKGIDDNMESMICRRKIKEVFGTNKAESNGKPEGQKAPALVEAMRLSGGYVEYLRANTVALAEAVHCPEDVEDYFDMMARFVAHTRARPSRKQDERKERELAGRLSSQLARLALCTAMVLGRNTVDDEVYSNVRQVALDSASGKVLDLATRLYRAGQRGEDANALSLKTGDEPHVLRNLLRFLKEIRVAEDYTMSVGSIKSEPRWRLSPTYKHLYEGVVND